MIITQINSVNRECSISVNNKTYKLTKAMVEVRSYTETKHVEEIIPNVIEPSFGIGRIMYSLFEHNFRIREGDENRTVSEVIDAWCSRM